MPAESFVDEDEQERQIQECEASAMQMKKRVRWFCLVSGCLLSAVFAYYALAQTTQVFVRDDAQLDGKLTPALGRMLCSALSSMSVAVSVVSSQTKRGVIVAGLASCLSAASWLYILVFVWPDAISLFYAFPVATLAFYGISYQSLTAYELEAEFTRWRAAKYKYKEA